MKTCIKCNLEKDDNLYYTKSNICKECKKLYQSNYTINNKEKIDKYRIDNKDVLSEKNIKYQKDRRENNSDEIVEYRKKYRLDNKEHLLKKESEYREINREKIRRIDKIYREANREKLYEIRKNKINNNPLLKSKERIRILIANSITKMGYTKKSRTHEILGCSFEFFKEYIDLQFKDDMSWDNHGEWHLDHKIPISYSESEQDLIDLNHYSNFQPLWAMDNLSKGNKWCD